MGKVLLTSIPLLRFAFLIALAGASITQAQDAHLKLDPVLNGSDPDAASARMGIRAAVPSNFDDLPSLYHIARRDAIPGAAGRPSTTLLPVERTSFDATANGSEVNSTWTSADGHDNDGDGHNTGVRARSKRPRSSTGAGTRTASTTP